MRPKLVPRVPRWVIQSGAILGTVAGLIVLMLLLAGYFKPKVTSVPAPPATRDAIAERDIVEVTWLKRPRSETAVGTVRAVHEASVASKILARVEEVLVKAGQTVNQGDILVRLDDAELQARVKQAESAYAAAQAMLEQATIEHDRAVQLLEKNAIARAEFDRAVATRKTAQAELERARQTVEEAKILLEFATIRSPLTGVVIDKRVEPGDTASPGQVLVNLYEPNRMQLVATVRESLALRLKVGDPIPAALDALDHHCLATISEIVPRAETASRSFTIKVTGPCPPGAYSGMFGRIFIPLDEEELLVVPASAIIRVGQLVLVEVAADGAKSRRAVQLGRQTNGGYEVLSGLAAGERVILQRGQLELP